MKKSDVLLKHVNQKENIFFDKRFFRITQNLQENPQNQNAKTVLTEYVEKSLEICRKSKKARNQFFAEACTLQTTTNKKKIASIRMLFEKVVETTWQAKKAQEDSDVSAQCSL